MSPANISITVPFGFSELARPKLGVAEAYPSLVTFASRMEVTKPFKSSLLP